MTIKEAIETFILLIVMLIVGMAPIYLVVIPAN